MSRRFIPHVACLWLVWYAAGLTAPLVVWASVPAAETEECHCAHEAGVMCPMHKSAKDRAGCGLRSGTHQDPLMLVSLLAPIGVSRSATSAPQQTSVSPIAPSDVSPLDRPLTPESPPPRA